MDRTKKNLGLLGVDLIIFIVITVLFFSNIRSFYITPRYAGILAILISVLWSFFLCGFLKRVQVAITGERYSKLKDSMNMILKEDESFLQAYIQAVIKNVAIEEPIFRWIPFGIIFVLNIFLSSALHSLLTDIISMGSTSMWIVLYEDRLPHLIPYGPPFFIFVSNGMILEALGSHLLINTMVYFALIFEYELENFER